jgi:hypothetical protein
MASEYCTATESCAAILEHDDDWLIVGQGVTDVYAASFGGNVAADEAAVVVPKAVMDAHVKPLLDRIAELEAERARYIESTTEWAVRLSKGTVLEFQYDEEAARKRAATYRGTLLCCDVLSTDWREVETATDNETKEA